MKTPQKSRPSQTLALRLRTLLPCAFLMLPSLVFSNPFSYVEIGSNNDFGSNPAMALGNSNILSDGNSYTSFNIFALGDGNEIINIAGISENILMLGTANEVDLSLNSIVAGTLNDAQDEVKNSMILGTFNGVRNITNSLIVGQNNEIDYLLDGGVIGMGLIADTNDNLSYSLTIGRYNDNTGYAGTPARLFTIGNGTAANARKNALTVDENGKLSLFGSSMNTIVLDPSNSAITINGQSILAPNGSGNVGINNASPLGKLHIRETNPFSTGGANASIVFQDQSGAAIGDLYGAIMWARGNSNGGTPSAAIAGVMTSADGGQNDLAVFTENGSGTLVERMRVQRSTGNVGIGTSTPSARLHVYKTMGAAGDQIGSFTMGASGAGLFIDDYTSVGEGPRIYGRDRGVDAVQRAGLTITGEVRQDTNDDSGIQLSSGYNNNDIFSNIVNGNVLRVISADASLQYFTIKGSGNVGIGVAAPAAKLEVNGGAGSGTFGLNQTPSIIVGANNTATAGAIKLWGTTSNAYSLIQSTTFNLHLDSNSGSSGVYLQNYNTGGFVDILAGKVRVTSAGHVGIGTASPAMPLHIFNSSGLKVGATANNDEGAYVQNPWHVSNGFVRMNLGGNLHWDSATSLWKFGASGSNGFGAVMARASSGLWFYTKPSTSATGGTLTTTELETNYARMVIDQAGNVGIGTTAPDTKLHVNGDLRVTGNIIGNFGGSMGIGTSSPGALLHLSNANGAGDVAAIIQNNATTNGETASLRFRTSTSSSDDARIVTERVSSGNSKLHFYTNTGGTATNRLTINEAGNVGIGTSTPTAKLEVNGGLKVIGDENALFQSAATPGSFLLWNPAKNAFAASYHSLNPSMLANAMGQNSFAGSGGKAAGLGSTAFAHGSADGSGSVALINGNAIGTESLAIQSGSATGYGSVALLGGSAVGDSSLAIGSEVSALAHESIAIGLSSETTGYGSFALGNHAGASGQNSMAMGVGVRASAKDSVVVGRYNVAESHETDLSRDPIFTVGNGAAENQRNNALVVYKNGKMSLFSSSGSTTPTIVLDPTNSQVTVGGQSLVNPTTFSVASNQFSVSSSGNILFGNSANRSVGIGTVASGPGRVLTLGAGNAAGTNQSGGSLVLNAGQSTGNAGSSILFRTSAVGASGSATNGLADRMIINAAGNVGIGTTTPGMALDIKNTLKLDSEAAWPGQGSVSENTHNAYILANTGSQRLLRMGVVNDNYTKAEISLENNNTQEGTIIFRTATGIAPNNINAAAARMTVTGVGNVGIGTTSPTAKLDVRGSVRFDPQGDVLMGQFGPQ